MGFGSPRLCVQVKSSPSPADVNVLRGLQGVLQNFHAEQGLLVCWGGFKSSVNRVFEEKNNGLIVDYVGVFRDLQKALATRRNREEVTSASEKTPAKRGGT